MGCFPHCRENHGKRSCDYAREAPTARTTGTEPPAAFSEDRDRWPEMSRRIMPIAFAFAVITAALAFALARIGFTVLESAG